MSPHKEHHFERDNAAQWDTESNISELSTARNATRNQAPLRPLVLTTQSSSSRTSQPGPSLNEKYRPRGQPQQRQRTDCNLGSQRQGRRPATTRWAEPSGLVTTREAIFKSEEALKKAEFDVLCTRPDSNDAFKVTGYYLWPKSSKDPMSLFDPTLKAFDQLRITYKVHIDWNDKTRCLRVSCNGRSAENNVADAIQGIKVLQQEAYTLVISASPEYIIVPPSGDAMRSIVQPKAWGYEDSSNIPLVTSIELAGDPLSTAKKLEWESYFRQMNNENYEKFRDHLIHCTLPLGALRGWMRMRIHFGHVNLSQYQDAFATGRYTFDSFLNMMKKPRVATGSIFDRKMDVAIAMSLINKIVSLADDFCPRSGKTPTLGDVLEDPKYTEIILVTTPNSFNYRLEAEIERVESGATGIYQIGHTRLFANDRRNKRMEITTVDIERGLDWTAEIIQDGEIQDIPGVLKQYIAASISSRSEELVDILGLRYPAITLRAPTEFIVHGVIMRSVFQYMWLGTGNVIEIAIYREWDGCKTKTAPLMQASVSMFNPDWDSEMRAVENDTKGRNWDPQLHNFFGKDGFSHTNTGLKGLVHEIREVQGFLSEAAKVCSSFQRASITSGTTAPS